MAQRSFGSGSRAQQAVLSSLVIWWSTLATVLSHPEYRAQIPNGLSVQFNGLAWQGVGHLNAAGGGPRNAFGKDFAAEGDTMLRTGHQWTPALCAKDSDGDGWTNGQELGDPLCVWKPGGPPPSRTTCISHPGMPNDTVAVECLAQLGEKSNVTASSPKPSTPGLAPIRPQDIGNNRPETWCEDRDRAGLNATEWVTHPLPTVPLIAKTDIYTCSRFQLPSVSTMPEDEADLVEMKINHDNGLFMHHLFVLYCDADMLWIQDAVDDPTLCMRHSSSLLATCNTLWNARIGSDTYCTPPNLVMANLGDLKRRNKVLVAQVHWAFSAGSVGKPVTVSDASIMFGFRRRNTQAPPLPEMNGWHGLAILANNSMTGHYGSLILPPQQPSLSVTHESGRRCTLVPFKGSPTKPQKYVNIIGYRFHMHQYGTNMTVRVKRCPNNHNGEKDVVWKIDGFNVGVQPVYEVPNGGIKLYAGDTVEWTCTYNTMNVNHTVVGGYRFELDEMCNIMLIYWPTIEAFNGCASDQYNNNICFNEAKAMIQEKEKYEDEFPIRPAIDPFTTGPFPWSMGWKATWFLVCLMGVTALLWIVHLTLVGALRQQRAALQGWAVLHSHHQTRAALADVGHRYTALNGAHRRNVSSYFVHLLVDTAGFIWILLLLLSVWCMCGDWVMNLQSFQINLTLLISIYILEMVWKPGMDLLLLSHHLATIAIIVVFGMEIVWMEWQSADVLLVLALFAYLEHPTFLALLMYRMAPRWKGLLHMWTFSCWFWIVSKVASVGVAVWLLIIRWSVMETWMMATYTTLWAFMFSLEMVSARIQIQIRNKIRRQLQADTLASQVPSAALWAEPESAESNSSDATGAVPPHKDVELSLQTSMQR